MAGKFQNVILLSSILFFLNDGPGTQRKENCREWVRREACPTSSSLYRIEVFAQLLDSWDFPLHVDLKFQPSPSSPSDPKFLLHFSMWHWSPRILISWLILWIIWLCPPQPMKRDSLRLSILLGVPSPQNISCIRNRFMFVNEYSFFCCCSHRLCVQGLELCLWQPDWEPHLSGVTGNFLPASALLLGQVSRFFCPGPSTAVNRWEGVHDRMWKVGYWGEAVVGKPWDGRMVGD